ncbi:MAG: YARHG domain-containing protein [Lachnospiraceae bacterium]|nr:YARHG domain-containing protein [Lachnospiraceae bacterium]
MKKRMTWFLAILLVAVLVTGCSGRKNQDSGSEQSDGQQATIGEAKTSTEEDSHVLMVKNGCPSNYPDSPYGQVFEKYFENPSWGYFQAKDEKGNIVDIVEFTGDCEFEKADYKAQIQFTVDVTNNSFEATYLALDGEAQTMTTLQKVLADAYSKEGPAVSGQVGVPAAETTATTVTTAATQATTAAPAPAPVPAPATKNNYYILPYSSTYALTYSDISHLTKSQLRLARNEIYARHGRMFSDDSLQNYFNSQAWYTPLYSPSEFKESWLSSVEVDNVAFIKSYE